MFMMYIMFINVVKVRADFRRFVHLVAECQSICWTGLGTCRKEISFGHILVIEATTFGPFDFEFAAPEPLYTESTFFGDSTGPGGYVRVEIIFEASRPCWMPEIKETDLIRAVIYAVASTDTPIVDLNI